MMATRLDMTFSFTLQRSALFSKASKHGATDAKELTLLHYTITITMILATTITTRRSTGKASRILHTMLFRWAGLARRLGGNVIILGISICHRATFEEIYAHLHIYIANDTCQEAYHKHSSSLSSLALYVYLLASVRDIVMDPSSRPVTKPVPVIGPVSRTTDISWNIARTKATADGQDEIFEKPTSSILLTDLFCFLPGLKDVLQ